VKTYNRTPKQILTQDHPNQKLLSHVIRNAGKDGKEIYPRWHYVAELFELGSGVAIELCEKFKANPHEIMGTFPLRVACATCREIIEDEREADEREGQWTP
jgi:hypothetical protein